MNHRRPRAAMLAMVCAVMAGLSASAHAAPQVSRFSLLLSVNPTQIKPDEFNERVIGNLNRTGLQPRGLEPIDEISFAWFYDAQLRYFVRPDFAVEAGVGHMRSFTKREFLPALNIAIEFRAEVLSVPVHMGGAYYLPAYTQGDFAARMYLGGGMMSLVHNRGRFQGVAAGVDSATAAQANFMLEGKGDAPGFYVESGFHLFFASRYSVMLGALYRGAKVRGMQGTAEVHTPNGIVKVPVGRVYDLDFSGIGGRFAVVMGL